ncbi:MAG: cyclic pyranopterin monophosphate synthase MoaC [Armatimonadetes bacterium]|nr:cyclic pyranopterin monophosphate synthase MoaC [Armatimonadota bacterium]
MNSLSHVDCVGRAKMVDVGEKPVQRRVARASGRISLAPTTIKLIRENLIKKGDVLTVAQIAGVQAAKRTSDLIPLCHPLQLDSINVEMELGEDCVAVTSEVHCEGKTGVEMEAITAVAAALLSIYDMCKAVDKSMVIGDIRLIEKVKQNV